MDGEKKFSLWGVREVDHLFSAFARYTRFVLYSKWAFGIIAIVLMVSLIGYPLLTKDRSGIRVSFVGTDSKGQPISSPVMNNPEYQGTDANGQQYKVTGARAIQKTPELIVIENVEGQLVRADGSFVALSADSAEYKQKAQFIDLIGNVTITDASGYTFLTPRATVNTATMDVDGNEAVEGDGPQGKLLATGFKIRDNGKQISFGGTSRVTVKLDKMRQD